MLSSRVQNITYFENQHDPCLLSLINTHIFSDKHLIEMKTVTGCVYFKQGEWFTDLERWDQVYVATTNSTIYFSVGWGEYSYIGVLNY